MGTHFLLPIDAVFQISGRGIVVTGEVVRGTLRVNDEVEIVGIRATRKTTVRAIEHFDEMLKECRAGDNVGVVLGEEMTATDFEQGQVLAAPGSIQPHKVFKASIEVFGTEEGGRKLPFFDGYRPQFYFRTTDVTGTVTLLGDKELVRPGEKAEISVELLHPFALEIGTEFSIREGGRAVASGKITELGD